MGFYMKKKNMNLRMVKTMDEERRVIGICAECESEILDNIEEYYCDEDGNYFDDIECAMAHHRIHKLEV